MPGCLAAPVLQIVGGAYPLLRGQHGGNLRVDIHQPARSRDLAGVLGGVFDVDGWPVLRCIPVWAGLHTELQSVPPTGPIDRMSNTDN